MFLQPHLYGFLIALSLLVLYFYTQKRAQLYSLKTRGVESAFLVSVVFALIGARLYHVLSSFSYYSHSPLKIFFVWEGGLGIFGALIGGFLGTYLYTKLKKMKLMDFLNLLAPPILLAQAIGRLGNFFNNEGFGPPIFMNSSYFHPTFFYESFLCLVAFGLFLYLSRKFKSTSWHFAYYLFAYGIIRFFTEFFRLDTWLMGSIHLATLLSLSLVIGGAVLLKIRPKE